MGDLDVHDSFGSLGSRSRTALTRIILWRNKQIPMTSRGLANCIHSSVFLLICEIRRDSLGNFGMPENFAHSKRARKRKTSFRLILSVDELLTLLFFFTNRDTETIFRKA